MHLGLYEPVLQFSYHQTYKLAKKWDIQPAIHHTLMGGAAGSGSGSSPAPPRSAHRPADKPRVVRAKDGLFETVD